jgi:bifunctional NMN adenylyltransferase/nudix hydrolase
MTEVGVLVGRFQVDDLHPSHVELIEFVKSRHPKVIILLGCSRVPGTRKYPLDYNARRLMIQEKYPDIIVLPIMNQREDETWSDVLDDTVGPMLTPGQKATLYGGRDSFIPHYSGRFPVVEVEEPTSIAGVSGTVVRQRLANTVQANAGFRAGAIWQAYNRFPLVISTVDIAIVDFAKNRLLLAQKPNETKWRLIGGFADVGSETDEEDAKRETMEETGLETGAMYYLGSFKIKDWRYAGEADGIRTRFFVTPYIYGTPEAKDDIKEVKWIDLTTIDYEDINPEHQQMVHELAASLSISSHRYYPMMMSLRKAAMPKVPEL